MTRKMKDSGVEWIGEMNTSWKTMPLKFILRERRQKNMPIITNERLSLSIGVGVTLYSEKTTNLDRFKDDVTQYKVAYPNDLVINSMNVIVGAEGISNYLGCVSPAYYVMYTINPQKFITKYYDYCFKTSTIQKALFYLGKGILAIDRGEGRVNTCRLKVSSYDLGRVEFPVPSINEQDIIVKFLDSKCNKIDKTIEKEKEVIEKLKEYKQSVITEAVTKGLNSDVKMKDSGVEWIGEIPEHWKIKKLKYEFRIKKNIAGREGYNILSVTQSGIKIKDISKNDGQLAMDYSKYQLVDIDDFIMNHMDLLTGFVDCSKYQGVTSPDYRVFYLIDRNKDKNYYRYIFQSCYKNKIFYGLGQGVSFLGRWRLQADKFLNFNIPVPPNNEQKEIADFLDKKCESIDKLIFIKEKVIEKLIEYKKSLIYECVTGKREVH
jgi:type I restriction enzyme S subunit